MKDRLFFCFQRCRIRGDWFQHKGVLVDWERSDDGWILKCKEKNGDRVFDIEIGKMSKSNIIKYCRDEWIVIPAEMMRRLRGKEKKE